MALTSAQLVSAITPSQLLFNLTNIVGSGLPAVGGVPGAGNVALLIDSEIMYIVQQTVAGTVSVRGRGSDGTVAMAHDVNSYCYLSPSGSDFPLPVAGSMITLDLAQDNALGIGQSGVIPQPTQGNAVYNIISPTALASTLTAPSIGINGIFIELTSLTAAAHVITATGLIMDGTVTAPHNTLTFAAAKGATVKLLAENGFWNVGELVNVTVS